MNSSNSQSQSENNTDPFWTAQAFHNLYWGCENRTTTAHSLCVCTEDSSENETNHSPPMLLAEWIYYDQKWLTFVSTWIQIKVQQCMLNTNPYIISRKCHFIQDSIAAEWFVINQLNLTIMANLFAHFNWNRASWLCLSLPLPAFRCVYVFVVCVAFSLCRKSPFLCAKWLKRWIPY